MIRTFIIVFTVAIAIGSLGLLAFRLGMRWLLDSYGDETVQLRPPVQKFVGFDPALRERTAMRRLAADKIRTKAAHVETGARVADVLRLVSK